MWKDLKGEAEGLQMGSGACAKCVAEGGTGATVGN